MNLFSKMPFEIIGGSFGLGSSEKGTAFGPHALLSHNLLDALTAVRADTLLGPVVEPVYLAQQPQGAPVKHLREFLHFHALFEPEVRKVYEAGRRPITLGGDHAISISSIATAAQWLRRMHGNHSALGILWVDSHADINSDESSTSKNIHGMPLRVLLGEGVPDLVALNGGTPSILSENIVYVGLRDVDDPEKNYIHANGIKYYSIRDIDARGIGPVITDAIDYLASRTTGVIASFDLDACDPVIVPGVGTPVRAGLTERESHFIMEEVAMIPNLLSVELVELNPELDKQAQTALIGVRLLESALGKRIM